jgi:hypothetical protein
MIHLTKPLKSKPGRYRADLTAGALKIPESRVIAGLLLSGLDENQWRAEIMDRNVLQVRNPATAKRLTHLLRNRLETMEPPLGSSFAMARAMLPHTLPSLQPLSTANLLGDFLQIVVAEQYRLFQFNALSSPLFADYLDGLPRARSRNAAVERIHVQAAAILSFPDTCPSWLHR